MTGRVRSVGMTSCGYEHIFTLWFKCTFMATVLVCLLMAVYFVLSGMYTTRCVVVVATYSGRVVYVQLCTMRYRYNGESIC